MYDSLYELIEETLADFDIEDPVLVDTLTTKISDLLGGVEDGNGEDFFNDLD